MRKLVVPILIIVAVFYSNCKKHEDNFSYCLDCPLSSWVGYFEGTGAYFTVTTGETTDGVQVGVNIENNYNSNLEITVDAPGYITETFSKSKTDTYHYLNIGTGARTLDLGLRQKGNELRLDGTLKKNTWNKIDSVWDVHQSLTFQILKSSK